MEDRWYLHPGQTLENTKIEDRGHALHITGDAWGKIAKHLDRKKDIQDALDREEAKRRYLDEGSKNMIKNWDNSLENIRLRKEEARLKRIEDMKEDRMRRFFQLREEQAEIRKQYVEKVKKEMFMTRGFARDINSALVTTEVAYEREKQKEFKKFIQKHEQKELDEYAQLVKENANKEKEEKAQKARKLFDGRKDYGAYLKSIMEENELKERTAKETQIKKESLDNVKAIREMEFIKKKEEEQKMLEKKEMNEDKIKHLKSIEERKKQLEQEEKEMDDVLEIYRAAKHEIDCLKIAKEIEKQEAIVARREAIAKKLVADVTAKSAAEEKQLKAAIAEREALEEEKLRAKAEYAASIRQQRLDDRNKFLERKKEEQRREGEMKKWQMVNRYKINEFTKQYEENKKREQWNKILERRKELLDQMEEDEKERQKAREMDECLSRVSYADDDAKFFAYADEVLELAKKKGRSTYPIEKVILEYRKINSLILEGEKSNTCEDITTKDKKSLSREILKNSVKKRTCKCNVPCNKK